MRKYNPIEIVFPFLIIVPIGLYLLGKLFGVIWLQQAGGYIAAAVIVLFVVAAVTGTISWNRFLNDSGKKAERVKGILDSLRSDGAGILEFRSDGIDYSARWVEDKFLIKNSESESVISASDLSSMLMITEGFPRYSRPQQK